MSSAPIGTEMTLQFLLKDAENKATELAQQLVAALSGLTEAQARIKELTQGDPAWYDMSEADAFRMWAEDRKKLAELEQRLKDTPA